jgi:sensor domain CHASE-containing protein
MSDNRNTISNENWVYLYSELSSWIQEYSSLDPIWIIDEDGNEVRTEEKQDEFIDIVDQVEAIMETVLERREKSDE